MAATAPMRGLVTEIQALIGASETRIRRRRADAQALHEAALEALVCDVIHRALQDPDGRLAVEMSKSELSLRRRRAPFLTKAFPGLVRSIAATEKPVVEFSVGHKSALGGARSTIKAGAWLLQRMDSLELTFSDIGRRAELLGDPLLLRSEKVRGEAAQIPIPDSDQARVLRAQMIELNHWLAQADLRWAECEVSMGVDLGQRFLRRIFNDGSLDKGGRMFFGFWQGLSKVDRLAYLRIDGQPVASLDFAQMSVRLAYGQVGVLPPEGDLYQVYGVGGSRDGVKQVMNALFASKRIPTRFPQGTRALFPRGVKIHHVIDAISRRHPALVALFGSGQALTHQFLESTIIIRSLLRLKELGVVALPVHDCILVEKPDVIIAKEVLETMFWEVSGVKGKVEVEGMDQGQWSTESLDGYPAGSPKVIPTVDLRSPLEGGVSA